jgi:hypothetical protein
MRKVFLTLAFLTALFTAVNSATAVSLVPDCDPCPFVR